MLTAIFTSMVGFNRRFSSLSVKMKELMSAVLEPKSIVMTVNAGFIPPGIGRKTQRLGVVVLRRSMSFH